MKHNKNLAMILAGAMALSNLASTSQAAWWETVTDTVVGAVGEDVTTADLEAAAGSLGTALGSVSTEDLDTSALKDEASGTGTLIESNKDTLLEGLSSSVDTALGDIALDDVGTLLDQAATGLDGSVSVEDVTGALGNFVAKENLSDVNEALGELLDIEVEGYDVTTNLNTLLDSLGVEVGSDKDGSTSVGADIVGAITGTSVENALSSAQSSAKEIYDSAQEITEAEFKEILTDLTEYTTTEGLATVEDLLDIATTLTEMVAEDDGLQAYLDAITDALETFNDVEDDYSLSLDDLSGLLLDVATKLEETADEDTISEAKDSLNDSFATLVDGLSTVVTDNSSILDKLGVNTDSLSKFLTNLSDSLSGETGTTSGTQKPSVTDSEVEADSTTDSTSSSSSSSGTKYSYTKHENGCYTITITYTNGIVKKITYMPNGVIITQMIQDEVIRVTVTGVKEEVVLFVPFDCIPYEKTEVYEVVGSGDDEIFVAMDEFVTIQEDSLDIVVDYNITMEMHNAFVEV